MKRSAFTLVELLIVIAIVGLLSTMAVVALNQAGVNSRNAKRKADMVQMSKALELFYSDYGRYPSTGGDAYWRGSCTVYESYPDAYVDATHDAWIPELTPNYMKRLPRDPDTDKSRSQNAWCVANPGSACFLYTSDGIDYKIIDHCAPEGTLSASDPFADTRPYSWSIYSPAAKGW